MKKADSFASMLIQDFLSVAPQGLSASSLHQCLVDQGLAELDASRQLRRAVDRGEIKLGENLQFLSTDPCPCFENKAGRQQTEAAEPASEREKRLTEALQQIMKYVQAGLPLEGAG